MNSQATSSNGDDINVTPPMTQTSPTPFRVPETKFKLEKPPCFKERRSTEEARSWLWCMDRYLTLTQVPPDMKTIYAALYLTDEALYWYQTISGPQFQHPGDNWDEFKTIFYNRFQEINSDAKLMDRFFALNQASKKTKSIREYTETFVKIYTALSNNITETVVLWKYVSGLLPRTRTDVECGNPTTLQRAIELADMADDVNRYTFRHQRSQSNLSQQKATPTNGEPMDLSTISTTEMSKNTMRKLGLCFLCK